MLVCHVTSVHPWTDTRIYTRMFCGLLEENIQVLLVAPNYPESNHQDERVVLLDPPNNRFDRILTFRKKIVNAALALKPDIVHLHDPELFGYTKLFQRHGIRVVLDWHEDFPNQIKIKHWIPKLLRSLVSAFAKRWVRKITRCADASITVTPPIVEAMSYANPLLVRNFPTLREYPKTVKPITQRSSIVYLGALSPNRGSDTMAKALSNVAQNRELTWVVIGSLGEGATEESVGELASPCRVEFRGRLDRKEIAKELSNAQIGLCVIKNVHNYLDSYPTKVFEYMMWGVPVVMSRFDTLVQLFGEEVPGIFVDPESVSETQAAIIDLLDHPSNAQKFSNLGRKQISEQLNSEVDLAALINLYRSFSKG